MAIVAPALLAENAAEFKTKIENVQSFANRIHIDISDGEFAPTFTINESEVWWPQGTQADLHAMVARPSEHVQQLVAKQPHMIIFHAEVQEDLVPIFQFIRQQGIKAGLALQRHTVPNSLSDLIMQVDHVMIFSGELGKHGGTASMMQLEKVGLIRTIRPDIELGWDGGVIVDNAFSLAQGGIDVLNVGGAINDSGDPAKTYQDIVNETNKHGVI